MRSRILTIATVVFFLCVCASAGVSAKGRTKLSVREIAATMERMQQTIDSLSREVEQVRRDYVPRTMPTDTAWAQWRDVRYNYGFNTASQPIHNTVDGILETTTMLSVRGGRGRWNSNTPQPRSIFVDGGHLFEGWNGSETCRLTMLIGKQAPDIACIQVYSPKGLYRPKRHFGWVKLGSDDKNEGVDFGRRFAVSFVPFALAALDTAPSGTMYLNEQLPSTAIPLGTLYYDTVLQHVRCYTAEGWKNLKFE